MSIWKDILFGLTLVRDYWWAYLPVLLCLSFGYSWLGFKRREYLDSLQWTLLQIKPPPQSDRSLKAVEQIFAGVHGIFTSPVNWKDQFFKGKIPDWFSLEIVGEEGGTNFYIRTLENYKSLVTANIFAQYPNVEITEAEDYMKKWPRHLPNEEYDLFGSEFILSKENAYPIQTYPVFEEKAVAPEDLRRLDPLASVSEVFSTFVPGENFVIQFLIRPVGDGWTKEAQKVIDKLLGKEVKEEKDLWQSMFGQIDKWLAFEPPKKEEKKEKKLSSPEEDIVKAMGKKIAKLGYEAGLRLVYLARKENFHRYHFAAIGGAFRQFTALNLNSFKPNMETVTFSKGYLKQIFPSDKGFWADKIVAKRKIDIFEGLKNRIFPADKYFVLNTEELATVFHLPGTEVKAPLFPRVEAKKGQPPPGLAIE